MNKPTVAVGGLKPVPADLVIPNKALLVIPIRSDAYMDVGRYDYTEVIGTTPGKEEVEQRQE